ncbi:MAG: nitroreductase family protein [Subdoligranulum sp.]
MIRVDSSKCMGCGQCAAICPTGNIQIRGAKAEVLGNCMNCGHCYAICPAQAVQMPPEAGCVAQEQPDAARIEAADFLQLVRSRRSIRKYKPRPVEEALLAEILEAGRYMATGGNAQSVRYLVIQKRHRVSRRRHGSRCAEL